MAPKCRLNCVESALSRFFKTYGAFVARHPWPFLVIPVVVFLGLTAGIVTLEREDDIEVMYTPTDGKAKDERRLVQHYFPENHTHFFKSSRKTDETGTLQIVITGAPGVKNIYTVDAMREVTELDNIIRTKVVDDVTYEDICGKWNGQCSPNVLLQVIEDESLINVSYPLHNGKYFLGAQLGGVDTDTRGFVEYAEAVLLTYYVAYQTKEQKQAGDVWMDHMINYFLDSGSNNYIQPNIETSLSMNQELKKATSNIPVLFSIAYTLLMTFASLSTSMKDWVRCKPWVTIAGELSAVFAVGTSLGLLSLCGSLFTSTVGSMPFLIVGIGIDNMFVLLSSWRHTNYLLPVEDRMATTFEKAAVSITLTSATNAIALAVGSYTSFRSIQLFCAYTGVAVIFCYINTITLLAACMVFSGRREARNLHAILPCKKATPKEELEQRSKPYQICCSGGDRDTENPEQVTRLLSQGEERIDLPYFSTFLSTTYSSFLLRTPVKVIVILTYFVYIGFSIWGCVTLQEGVKLKNLATDDSYLVPFYGNYSEYFTSEYGPRVMVVIHEPLDYYKPEVSHRVHDTVQSFQDSDFFFSEKWMSESWLKDFEAFLTNPGISRPNNMAEFIYILRQQFLVHPYFEKYQVDLNFSQDYSQILGSRFMVQSNGIKNAVQEKELLLEVRRLCDESVYQTIAYHAAFIFYDQYIVILFTTIRNLFLAALCMFVIAMFLLPHVLAWLWVTLSVLSICAGVIGFMVFWDVSLDSISMINLIMCIGFSVDFSGHICYHFTTSEEASPIKKLKETMKLLGLPICQGAVSTVLGVCVLGFSNSYIFRTFFKLIFLVVLFGFYHAMVILPVILPTIGPGSCKQQPQDNSVLDQQDPETQHMVTVNSSGHTSSKLVNGSGHTSPNGV